MDIIDTLDILHQWTWLSVLELTSIGLYVIYLLDYVEQIPLQPYSLCNYLIKSNLIDMCTKASLCITSQSLSQSNEINLHWNKLH